MSSIASNAEDLILNADGGSSTVKIKINGTEKASISSAGAFTSTTIDATKLTGTIPNFTSTGIDDNADATAMTIDSSEKIGIGITSPTQQLHSYNTNAHRLRVANANYGIDLHQPAGASSPHINAYGADVSIIFDVNDSEKMRINSTGAVTMPAQPAFLVYHNATTSNIANGNTISFNEEKFDQNSDFNISNEIFTAPVTGKYQFSFLVSVTSLDASATYNRILLKSSNRTVPFGITHANMFSGDPGYYSFEGSMLLDMDANDTCFLEWNQAGGTAQADVFDSTYFSGYLAC